MNDDRFDRFPEAGDVHSARCPLAGERWSELGRSLSLTRRELQIIQFLFDGQHEPAIAKSLAISRHTVHTHLGRLYKKLEVDSCTGLLLRVFHEYVATDGRVYPPRPWLDRIPVRTA